MEYTMSAETVARLEAVLNEMPPPLAMAMLGGLAAHGNVPFTMAAPATVLEIVERLQTRSDIVRELWSRTASRPCCSADERDSVVIASITDESARRRRDMALREGRAPIRPVMIAAHNPHDPYPTFAMATIDMEDAKQVVNRLCVAIAEAAEQEQRLASADGAGG